MNVNYLYPIGTTVWIVNATTDVIESWVVTQVSALATVSSIVINYILRGKRGMSSFNELTLYASLSDALGSLT